MVRFLPKICDIEKRLFFPFCFTHGEIVSTVYFELHMFVFDLRSMSVHVLDKQKLI